MNRYDYVGSFLRPERLKKARRDFENNTISLEELKKVEDECITELITKIKELGYHTITDGEFRRSTWHLDFMWGLNGVEHKKTIEGNTTFDGEAAMIDDTYVTGKISCDHHPFVDHFKFVKQFEDENTLAKQTIPSPGQFYAYFTGVQLLRNTLSIYENEEAFASDVVRLILSLSMKFMMQDAVYCSLMIVYGVVWSIQNLHVVLQDVLVMH